MSYVSRKNWKNKSSGFGYENTSRNRIGKIILFILMLFFVFELVTSLFVVSYRVESISMEPTIPSGSILLATPLLYGPEFPFLSVRIPGIRTPNRGDLVISTPVFHQDRAWYVKAIDSFISFFTLQKKGFGRKGDNWVNSRTVKRVVGIPGDTVMMTDSEVLIKPQGKNYFFSEKEIMQVQYSTASYTLPELMTDELPFSGNMHEIELKSGEYFLAGDNRSMSNDSYYWGPVTINNIKAKVILEYSPEIKIPQ